MEFVLGMQSTKLKSPIDSLPPCKEPLFVSKPIGNYEPIKVELKKLFDPDPTQPIKKYFPETASTNKEARDI
jgi:hypothetical protein